MKKFEIDIEIKDLLWEFARRWRIIVVFAFLCAIVLGVYQYKADSNKTTVTTVKKTQEELENAMSEQDLDEVTAAVALLRQANQKRQYMETSELMRINPYEANAVFLQYYVNTENLDGASDITEAYKAYANNTVSELVSVVDKGINTYINTNDSTETFTVNTSLAEEGRFFSVKIVGLTAENAEQVAIEVESVLADYGTTLTETIGTHQLQLVEKTSLRIVDQQLAELQNINATEIKTISNNLDKMKNEMTGDQISLYTYRTTTLAEENNIPVTTPVEPASISVTHIAIGAILGAILACGIIFVLYLFASTLRNGEEIKVLYGVKILGYVNDSAFDKKKAFAFVDHFIEKLQNHRNQKVSYEQGLELACANIVADCKKNGNQKLFLTSSTIEQVSSEVLSAIESGCEDKGIQVIVGDTICYDAKALEALAQIGNVVFVEKKHVSSYDEMYQEMLLCKDYDIHVAGVVVLG